MSKELRAKNKQEAKDRQPRKISLRGTPFNLVEAIDRRDQSYWFIFSDYELRAQTGNIKITAFVDPADGEGYMLGHAGGDLLPLGYKVESSLLEKVKKLATESNIQLTPLFSVYQKQGF